MVQQYSNYTSEDFQVWKILFERQLPNIKNYACQTFLDSLQEIGFDGTAIPHFEEVNKKLVVKTGWQIQVVPSIVPIRDFFILLSEKKFPSTTWLRSMEQLDYLNEPDMFHDCFGHMPMLINKDYCLFLEKLSEIGTKYIDEERALELLGRLYWFSIEFGLVREQNIPKILGAGLISSYGEALQSVDAKKVAHIPFSLDEILKTSYINSSMQNCYFELESMDELYSSVNVLEEKIVTLLESDYEIEVGGMMM
jgi:phenylalanine-4-hydroxylase